LLNYCQKPLHERLCNKAYFLL